MSFNLIDLIKDQLSEQVMNQVGNMLGSDSSQLSSAVGSAIPGLLSGLVNMGSDSSSANTIVNAINNQDDSILDNLGDLLGGDNSQGSLISSGSKMLSSVLGDNMLGNLAGAIGGFSGLGNNSSKSLLGLLAPIVFSVIKRKLVGSGGLNLSSLMDMFSAQKDNISAAMPSGFEQQLQASGFTSRFSDTLNTASENISETAEETRSAGAAWLARLVPLLLLLGIIWFAYNQFLKSEIEIPELKTEPTIAPVAIPKPKVVENTANLVRQQTTNIKDELDVILGSVTSSLGSIKDVETAQQAIPQLNVATQKLGGLSNMVNQLPEAAKMPVQQIISGALPQVQGMIDKISAIPGVGAVIKPVADNLLQKLALFQ